MHTIREAQEHVTGFNNDREWMKPSSDMKDLLLNIGEETGEAWNLIKWVDVKKQKELFAQQAGEWEDFVGDQLYLILKIAAMAGVDAQKGFDRTMREYDERFPIEKVKGTHTNIRAGGHDGKYAA